LLETTEQGKRKRSPSPQPRLQTKKCVTSEDEPPSDMKEDNQGEDNHGDMNKDNHGEDNHGEIKRIAMDKHSAIKQDKKLVDNQVDKALNYKLEVSSGWE